MRGETVGIDGYTVVVPQEPIYNFDDIDIPSFTQPDWPDIPDPAFTIPDYGYNWEGGTVPTWPPQYTYTITQPPVTSGSNPQYNDGGAACRLGTGNVIHGTFDTGAVGVIDGWNNIYGYLRGWAKAGVIDYLIAGKFEKRTLGATLGDWADTLDDTQYAVNLLGEHGEIVAVGHHNAVIPGTPQIRTGYFDISVAQNFSGISVGFVDASDTNTLTPSWSFSGYDNRGSWQTHVFTRKRGGYDWSCSAWFARSFSSGEVPEWALL